MGDVVEVATVSLDGAVRVVVAALDRASKMGVAVVVAVADQAGELKAYARMDGATLLPVRIAQDKAWTAAAFEVATHELWERVRNKPSDLHGLVKTDRLMVLGGGLPLVVGGRVVGGIGVSGGTSDQDRAIAEAGVRALDSKIAALD